MGLIDNRDAQFMLLAGFIIALGIVITTVLLNNIIFQGNMAGEAGSDPSKYEIVNLMAISADDTKSAYRSAITLVGNNAQIAYFNNQTQNFSANLSKMYALHGEAVNITWNVSNWNTPRYPNFTKYGMKSAVTNWTVIESVNQISGFNLTYVNGSNFQINISNETTGLVLWSLNLTAPNTITITNFSGQTYSYNIPYNNNISLLNSSYNLTNFTRNNITKIVFINGSNAWGQFNLTGSGNTTYGSNFYFDRDYILNVTVAFSTSRVRANITVPVSVPW